MRPRISRLRLLIALLIAELAAIIALASTGAFAHGSFVRWGATALLVGLPLAIALAALVRERFRFSLRTMLIASTLAAIFMGVGVWPLVDAAAARRGTRALQAERVRFRDYCSNDTYFQRLGYDPRPPAPSVSEKHVVPPWLRPWASNDLNLLADATVREIVIDDDAQAVAAAENFSRFPALTYVAVRSHRLSPAALALLQQELPRVESLTQLYVTHELPAGWLASMRQVRSLWIDGASPVHERISALELQEIAELPQLGHLYIQRMKIRDADLQILAQSASLRRVVLLVRELSPDAAAELQQAMPDCVIYYRERP